MLRYRIATFHLAAALCLSPCVPAASAAEERRTEEVTFTAKCDGTPQQYVILYPPEFKPDETHHLLIGLHGHGGDRWQIIKGNLDEHRAFCDIAGANKMLLVSPDYRKSTSWMGPKAEADLLQIIDEVKARFRIGKVIISGGSMGGSSALTFAAMHPDRADGVVSINGTANHLEYENFQDAIAESFGGTKARIPAEYKKRSAEYWPERLTMPIAMTVGVKDDVVPPASVMRLAGVLKKLQPNVLLLVDPELVHRTSYADSIAAFEFVLNKAGIKQPPKAPASK